MVDEKDTEEYHLSDVDKDVDITITSPEAVASASSADSLGGAVLGLIQRNALIVFGVVLALVFVYKFIGLFIGGATVKAKATPQAAAFQPITPVAATPSEPVASPQPQPAEVTLKPEVTQKLTALESNQQGVRSEVADLNAQVTGLQTNVQDISTQLASLMTLVQSLSQKVDAQNNAMAVLEARFTAKPQVMRRPHLRHHHRMMAPHLYYIQAIIPGRAWLIAANGQNTVTVRRGTRLPGYGVVQLIDPNQGRVLTSSGQTIKFSQQDS